MDEIKRCTTNKHQQRWFVQKFCKIGLNLINKAFIIQEPSNIALLFKLNCCLSVPYLQIRRII